VVSSHIHGTSVVSSSLIQIMRAPLLMNVVANQKIMGKIQEWKDVPAAQIELIRDVSL
jgi:hypothetical protein